jgi:hypothetical protein
MNMPLLFLEYMADVPLQAKKGGGHSSVSHKFLCHGCTKHYVEKEVKLVL